MGITEISVALHAAETGAGPRLLGKDHGIWYPISAIRKLTGVVEARRIVDGGWFPLAEIMEFNRPILDKE